MTSNNDETEFLGVVRAQRAARRTPHDDRVERWLGATAVVLTVLSIVGVIRWVLAYV